MFWNDKIRYTFDYSITSVIFFYVQNTDTMIYFCSEIRICSETVPCTHDKLCSKIRVQCRSIIEHVACWIAWTFVLCIIYIRWPHRISGTAEMAVLSIIFIFFWNFICRLQYFDTLRIMKCCKVSHNILPHIRTKWILHYRKVHKS